jgi:hypothetical protein
MRDRPFGIYADTAIARNCSDGRGKMLQHLHVSMAELSMEVGLTADAGSSASISASAPVTPY